MIKSKSSGEILADYYELLGDDPSETETLRGRDLDTYFSSYSHVILIL